MKIKLLFMTFFIISVGISHLHAQLYSNETLYYEEVNGSDKSGNKAYVVIIDGLHSQVILNCPCYISHLKENLAKNPNYYENISFEKLKKEHWNTYKWIYCQEKTTSNRYVYIKTGTGESYTKEYIGIATDKSSLIMWEEPKKNLDGEIWHKCYYVRIKKEDLLPKSVNYDFLNE